MESFFRYIIELNIVISILFLTYRLIFKKDRNFVSRRFFLLFSFALALILPLLPSSLSIQSLATTIPSFTFEELTIYGDKGAVTGQSPFSLMNIFSIIYFTVLITAGIKLISHFIRIHLAIKKSEKKEVNGYTILSNRLLHASSFFNYIFIDLFNNQKESINHILKHELVHRDELHSIDRIITEVLVIFCWFNPLIWLYRKSVIVNHEYLADSAVISSGININNYQISILNQYIESASITNQFSSQIKNRIKMLNTNYRSGSKWKITMLLPVALIAFFLISCGEKKEMANELIEESVPTEEEVFFVVEEMPTFNGESPEAFRYFIAKNIIYPKEAKENGVTGKVFVKFFVNSEGKVVVPEKEALAAAEGKPMDEVVVVAYRPIGEDSGEPDEKYIELLKEEAIRVVSSSPNWEPGKQRGKAVKVMFTFPITFKLQ